MRKALIPSAVAHHRPYHFNSLERKKNWTNKRTDKQYVADYFIHSKTCHNDVCTKFENPKSSSSEKSSTKISIFIILE